MTTDNDNWEYDAPQFVDFIKPESDRNLEEYFEHSREDAGLPVSFSESQADTLVLHSYKLRSSSANTPQQNGSAKSKLQSRTALREMNNLSPLCRQPKSATRSCMVKTDIQNTAERENACETDTAKTKQTDLRAVQKNTNNVASQENTDSCKLPGKSIRKRGLSVTDTVAKEVGEIAGVKRLRRSASSAMAKPRRSVNTKKSVQKLQKPSQSQAHGRSPSSGPVSGASQETPKKTTRKKMNISLNSKMHTRTLSSQSSDLSKASSEHQRTSSSSRVRTRSAHSDLKPNDKKPAQKLTMPMTPAVLKHQSTKIPNLKSSEQLEMEQINRFHKELVKKRQLAKDSMKMAKTSSAYVPVRAVHPVTEPKEFNFRTDQRLKATGLKEQAKVTEVDFAATLRHSDRDTTKKKAQANDHTASGPKSTIPQPFNLHENRHQTLEQSKFQSAAELMLAFSTKTPERFRTKPKNRDPTPTRKHARNTTEVALTVAKTPNLETRKRSRPVTAISQAEMEEREIEEIKKYKFHAKPVNERILKYPNVGVHKVPPKEPTKPEGFELETDRRIRGRQSNKSEDEDDQYEFHANPLPKKILEKPVGIKPVRPMPLTIPESPAFALKNRLRSYKQQQVEKQQQETKLVAITAKPVPYTGVPFQPVLSHKATEIQPFSFEERTRMMLAKKEEKIKQLLEEDKKMREFHANPLPDPQPDPLPEKCSKPPTVPEPFDLKVDQRSQHAEEWARKVEEEMREQRAMAQFKARPPVSIYKPPFIPKPSVKQTTDVQEFQLSTEQRKQRWAELERIRMEKEAEYAEIQREMEKRRKEAEEEEIRRLRNAAVHQANPVRHYKPVEIKPSDKPLTITESPRFSERLRSRVQHKSGSN